MLCSYLQFLGSLLTIADINTDGVLIENSQSHMKFIALFFYANVNLF